MGNGALPNGPSYRAHPRLYRLRHPAMSAQWSLSGAKRTWRGQSISVAIEPSETLATPNDCAGIFAPFRLPGRADTIPPMHPRGGYGARPSSFTLSRPKNIHPPLGSRFSTIVTNWSG